MARDSNEVKQLPEPVRLLLDEPLYKLIYYGHGNHPRYLDSVEHFQGSTSAVLLRL